MSYSAVCFLGMTIFLNIDISQGSVEIYLRRGGVYKYDCCNFTSESNSENSLKIG